MQCPFCGNEVRDLRKGLCDSCDRHQTENSSEPMVTYYPAARRKPFSIALKTIAAMLMLAMMFGLALRVKHFLIPRKPMFSESGGELQLVDTDRHIELAYTIGAEQIIKGHALSLDRAPTRNNIYGFDYSLSFMSEADYETSLEKDSGEGRSPASFLLTHAAILALIVDDSTLLRALGEIKVERGDLLEIRGEPLEISRGSYRGRPIRFSAASNIKFFRLRNIEIGNHQLPVDSSAQ